MLRIIQREQTTNNEVFVVFIVNKNRHEECTSKNMELVYWQYHAQYII